MIVYTGGLQADVRHGAKIETLVGESVILPFEATYVDGAGAGGVTIAGRTLTFSAPGIRRFRSADGMQELSVVACELACLRRINHGDRVGHGRSDRRLVLRNLAVHCDSFDGSSASMPDSLYGYGGN